MNRLFLRSLKKNFKNGFKPFFCLDAGGVIVFGICGKPLVLQTVVHILANDGIEHGKQRDAQNHARQAE